MRATICLLLSATLLGCQSHTLILDRDYETSLQAFRGHDPAGAIREFPRGEKGGWVTGIESSWLEIWDQRWNPPGLAALAEQQRYRDSDLATEISVVLRNEREAEYVPCEHEVVILHLLYATHLMQREQLEEAQVELRRAGRYLDVKWDDPALRLWLAALWQAAGQWPEAQVDLRRARELGADVAEEWLDEHAHAPAELELHFFGVGPHLQWTDGIAKPQVQTPAAIPIKNNFASTMPWFSRHLRKDHMVRDLTRSSNTTVQYVGSETLTFTEQTGAKVGVWGIRAAAAGAGIALMVGLAGATQGSPSSSEGTSYLLGLITAGVITVWNYAGQLDHEISKELRQRQKDKMEGLRSYRMVRYLPEGVALTNGPSAPDWGVLRVPLRQGVVLLHHF